MAHCSEPADLTIQQSHDELLSILLINLRNAAATFGEGTPPYESIRTTVEEHLAIMKAKGLKTDVARSRLGSTSSSAANVVSDVRQEKREEQSAPGMFSNLAFRTKPKG